MSWHHWPTLQAFNVWHTAACTALGIPHPGHNAATGQLDEAAQWTTAYTEPVVVAADDVRAVVEDDVAALVPDRLGVPCDPPPAPEPDPDDPLQYNVI
jgi:hypothetical protein